MRHRISVIGILMFAFALPCGVQAQDPKDDDYGCQLDDVTDSYFCSSGPLEGREFVTKSELDEAIEAYKAKVKEAAAMRPNEILPPDPKSAPEQKAEGEKPASSSEPHLKVMSWNMKALAGEGSDYDRAALVLAKADVIALQEVDTHAQGKGFINVIGNLIQTKTQAKVCRAWVQSESGERQSYGFLWRESAVGYVDNDGGIQESCGDSATVIRQTKKNKAVSQATFYFKPQKKMFVLATTYFDKKPKSAADKTVNELFKALDDGKWPVVLTGDLKMSAGNPAFDGARKLGFHSALSGQAEAWDNVWYRGTSLAQAGPIDLYQQFSDARREDIRRDFSGIFPVMAEFNLREQAKDSLAVVAKKPAAAKATAKKKKSKSKISAK